MIGMSELLINWLLNTVRFVVIAIVIVALGIIILFGTGMVKLSDAAAKYFDEGWGDDSEHNTVSDMSDTSN